ncbi:sensor histidine kinase [Varunaivibrio sulfuroxidans]|uniref:histidine kinase n=1 Tax=Varunaivibrio sulfuroxidans TaxID=1773489 RepID=A0A4R3JGG2_9PROT|nr:HAMP domain-containing sensor histidine kinase [Varunaivibrio sulfuroxidans]TCS65002.1 signal transduction histidine kinase [Varunaivibrio sulfuroxidans]WES29708.1 HAMP domain-containing sensor histidine kinase [Varunaivibrio sulfuroxidans]
MDSLSGRTDAKSEDQDVSGLGLSARLLVLTAAFVMFAEIMIYVPSISRFRKVYLEERLAQAQLAMLALEATPDNMLSKDLETRLLRYTGAYGIVVHYPHRRSLMLSESMPPKVDAEFDIANMMFTTWIMDAFEALIQHGNRVIRVKGTTQRTPDVNVEVVIDEAPLRAQMLDYSNRILQLSVVISLITGGLVYFSLQWLMVRPFRELIRAMVRFRRNPLDESTAIAPSGRRDEIGRAESELAQMQERVRGALKQQTRLATLGGAMAKINHDLRNSLATAVLVSDRLADIDDPEVQKVTPRLYTAIDRAVNLCSQTLNYVGDGRAPLRPEPFHVRELVAEVCAALKERFGEPRSFIFENRVPFAIVLTADREHLFRAILNIAMNALQAGAKTLRIEARPDDGPFYLDITDDGSGLPPRAQKKLFQPFVGSARDGGTGLGLVIARDIMHAHGGDVILRTTGETGTVFRLTFAVHATVARTKEDEDPETPGRATRLSF